MFGLTCSPFVLGGVLNEHLKSWEETYPDLVKEIRDGLYVDDLITGGVNAQLVSEKEIKAIEVFEDATFKLHKWHCNISELEGKEIVRTSQHTTTTEFTTLSVWSCQRHCLGSSSIGKCAKQTLLGMGNSLKP